MASVSLTPQTLDLVLYGGDGVQLQLDVTDDLGAPVPLTGTIKAQIRVSKVNPAAIAEFSTDITDEAGGIALISLTGSQTAALHGGGTVERFTGVWDVQWTPQDSEPVTILQGKVESNLDVTRT